jgi:hypothetical protein
LATPFGNGNALQASLPSSKPIVAGELPALAERTPVKLTMAANHDERINNSQLGISPAMVLTGA